MENKFLTRFDSVKEKFRKNLKDNIFKQEIETFTKYNIIDENNMFNYIYIHNYYENLIENPVEYKINIISKNKEQIISFISLLFNEQNINNDLNTKFEFKTYINFKDKSQKNLYDLYYVKNKVMKMIITNKSFKYILEYLSDEKNKDEINDNDILITTTDYKFNSYPSIIFKFYTGENYKTDIIPLINQNLEQEYSKQNENLILFEKNILNKYFNNKNSLYLTEQIYHRTTSIFTTLNVFLFNEEEWKQDNNSIINDINIKKEEKYKDVLINNIICNNEKNLLYYIDKEKEKDLFNSNTSYEDQNNYNLSDNIYKTVFNHFKNEMNFGKTYLLNYNSLINDHMKITFSKADPLILDENISEYLKHNTKTLIKHEEENYITERDKLFQKVITIPKNTLIENMSNIKQQIDSKYFITNGTFTYLQEEITKYLAQYQSQILSYMTQIDNLNINIFYTLKKILNDQGIFSINFDGLLKIIAVERISIQDPIQNILQQNNHTFRQILAGFGISGIIGGAASFITGRTVSTVSASAASGTFGGPVGIGVGVVFGVGTLLAQARYHFKGNRETINSLYEQVNNNILETINKVEDSINSERNKILESMEKDIKEIKIIMDIIIDRVIKLLIE